MVTVSIFHRRKKAAKTVQKKRQPVGTKKNYAITTMILTILAIAMILNYQNYLKKDTDSKSHDTSNNRNMRQRDQQVDPSPEKDTGDSSKRHHVLGALDSSIKTHSSEKGWKIVDWKDAITQEEEEKFGCDFTKFTSASTGKSAKMCVHTFRDIVSGNIKRKGKWDDCDILPALWNATTRDEKSVYVEIGANIGSCVMEMLLGTDANIIAFEPHPMNLFNLKKTVSELDPALQDRLRLVPVGLGHEQGSSTIYAASNNMGNSVIGKIIGDTEGQQFDEKLQFTINVERLDSILNSDIDVKLMKMDAQGFECNILEGMGNDIANAIGVIKFEWAAKWLTAQNCTDFLPRLRNYGFDVYFKYDDSASRFSHLVEENPGGVNRIADLFATRQKTEGYTIG
jgi:FkbM family methyltransferase